MGPASKSSHIIVNVLDVGNIRLALWVLIFNYFLTYKKGNYIWLNLICLNCGQLQKLIHIYVSAIFFFSCKLPEIRNSYFTSRVSFITSSDLLGTFSWSFSTFHTYIYYYNAIANCSCYLRMIILLTIPSWETTERYTQASDGDQYQLFLLIKQEERQQLAPEAKMKFPTPSPLE